MINEGEVNRNWNNRSNDNRNVRFRPAAVYSKDMNKAIFAAGCFWGVQYYFDQIPGVVNSSVGYTGGHTETLVMKRSVLTLPVMPRPFFWNLIRKALATKLCASIF